MTLAVGLMSGTSCDGVSAALADFQGRRVRLLAYRTDPYPPSLRDRLRAATEMKAPGLAQLNMALGERFAASALRVLRRRASARVAVIGSHGHTVYHGPTDPVPTTLQLGEPAVIAQRTGLPVVADFRMRDMAAGGQGAPLIPAFDHHVFGGGPPRALHNIGGIANVTLVGRGIAPVAFDTGPGNCLLDALARRLTHGRHAYDPQGRLAAGGRVDQALLRALRSHPYFRTPPPKSTGPELFQERWLDEQAGRGWRRRLPDTLATLTYLTAWTMADSYRRFLPVQPREVIVSGGGALNRTLMSHLRTLLRPTPVVSIRRYGLPPQAKEPVAFAWLALRVIHRRVNHLPDTTGAREACILGAITPGGIR